MSASENRAKAIRCIREKMQEGELETVMKTPEWHTLMISLSDDINTAAKKASSESEIAFEMDHVLLNISEEVLIPFGYDGYVPLREKGITLINDDGEEVTIQSLSKKGRIDSKYNNAIIEYKKPAKYRNSADIEKAKKQAISYLVAMDAEEPGEYMAIVTDGIHCQFIEWFDGEAHWEPVSDLDANAADRIVRSLIKLTIKSLSAENLIRDLVLEQHEGSNIIEKLTKVLYGSLSSMNDSTRIAYETWLDNFGLSHDDVSQNLAIEERRRDLAKIVDKNDVQVDEEYKILFALQTSTAVIAMLIAYKVVSVVKEVKREYLLSNLHNIESRFLRVELENIGCGAVSARIHIHNLLEIGCFSWVFDKDQWNDDIYTVVNDIICILLRYENMPELKDNADDLFRDLYMATMPTSVRHSLGEYYTEKWLAQHVIDEGKSFLPLDKIPHMRVLDTAAGSGTFPQNVIAAKREQYRNEKPEDALSYILDEVASIDANMIAVILARINYFISIADLIDKNQKLYIPAYIGDSTISNSEKLSKDKKYYIDIISDASGNKIDLMVPVASLEEKNTFIETIKNIEDIAEDCSHEELIHELERICCCQEEIESISDSWIELQDKGMINPAIISSVINYFLLCNLGKFDLIVGNPPWVDWKNLPSVHREKIKQSCISRDLFSGDGRTGGINLNVCALLSNISAENWLAEDGVMSILMPQSILFQQSYEGYRNFNIAGGGKLYFQEIVDWEKAGHPFYPVQQLFATYVLSATEQDYFKGITSKCVKLKRGKRLNDDVSKVTKDNFSEYFDVEEKILGRTTDVRTAFTYAKDFEELAAFQIISGETEYLGREGVEYYPQELQLFHVTSVNHDGTLSLRTYQNTRSKYSIQVRTPNIETTYLRPLVKGVNISRFHIDVSEFVVAFPYDEEHFKIPIGRAELKDKSPLLYQYYKENKAYLEMQTGYSDSIIGNDKAEYYALARTGKYSHAPWYVVFRDNTKWVSAVVGELDTDWGGRKTPAFQNHCVSICQRPDGTFITEQEAHYICAILNSHIVEDFVLSTSDKRTFKIRLPIRIKLFDKANETQKKLAQLSKKAHDKYADSLKVEELRNQIDELYIEVLK